MAADMVTWLFKEKAIDFHRERQYMDVSLKEIVRRIAAQPMTEGHIDDATEAPSFEAPSVDT